MSGAFSYVPGDYSHRNPAKKQIKIKDADLETIKQYLCPINNSRDPMMCLECKGREGCPPGQRAVELLEQETKPNNIENTGEVNMSKKNAESQKKHDTRTEKARNKFYSAMTSKDPIKYLLNNGCPTEHAAKEFIRTSSIRHPDLVEKINRERMGTRRTSDAITHEESRQIQSADSRKENTPVVNTNNGSLPSCSKTLFTQALLSEEPTLFLMKHFSVPLETAFEILTAEQRNYPMDVWLVAKTHEDPVGWYQQTFKSSSRQVASNRIRQYRKKFEGIQDASIQGPRTAAVPDEDEVSVADFISEYGSDKSTAEAEPQPAIRCANDEAIGSDKSYTCPEPAVRPVVKDITIDFATTIDIHQKKEEICKRKSLLEAQIIKCQEEIKKLDDIQKALDVLSTNNAYLKALSKGEI